MWIRELESNEVQEWNQFVTFHPQSTCYHHGAWRRVAQRVYGLSTHYLVARSKPNLPIQGIFPLFQLTGLGVCSHLSNGLFGAYAAPLANDKTIQNSLISHAKELLRSTKRAYLLIKTLDDQNPLELSALNEFRKFSNWVIAKLELPSHPDILWKQLKDKVRNSIRKAQSYRLELRTGVQEIPHFYDVLADNLHQKGAPIYGLMFIEELARAFGESAEVLTLWHDNKVISGALILTYQDTTYVPFASSRPTSFFMCPNNLLYWEIIRLSCQRGMKYLDFGRSRKDSTQLAFKRSWGATEISQPCYLYSFNHETFNYFEEENANISSWVKHWKHLPRFITDPIGPIICKQMAGLL